MSKASIIILSFAAGAITGGGIGLELLHLPPAIASGIGAGVSAAIVTWVSKYEKLRLLNE